MMERIYIKRKRPRPDQAIFDPDAPLPDPEALVLKIERTVESCRFLDHLQVTDAFFARVLGRALREGYYSQQEVTESMAKLRVLVERRVRVLNLFERSQRHS